MTNASITFGLEIVYHDSDADADRDKEVVLVTPRLEIFASADIAAAKKEGLNILEKNLWFFAFDGSPLKACFSKEPYFHADRKKYFPGIYSLQPGHGEKLQDVITKLIARNPSPHTRIIVRLPANDESAREFGWPGIKARKENMKHALDFLQADMVKRIVFE